MGFARSGGRFAASKGGRARIHQIRNDVGRMLLAQPCRQRLLPALTPNSLQGNQGIIDIGVVAGAVGQVGDQANLVPQLPFQVFAQGFCLRLQCVAVIADDDDGGGRAPMCGEFQFPDDQ